MKNLVKLLGIIALMAIIGFSFTACDNGSGVDDGSVNVEGVAFMYNGALYTGGAIASLEGFVGEFDHFEAEPTNSIGIVGSVSADNKLTLNLPADIADSKLINFGDIKYGVLSVKSDDYLVDDFGGTVLITKGSNQALLMYSNQDITLSGYSAKKGWNYLTPGSYTGAIDALITDLTGWTYDIVEW